MVNIYLLARTTKLHASIVPDLHIRSVLFALYVVSVPRQPKQDLRTVFLESSGEG